MAQIITDLLNRGRYGHWGGERIKNNNFFQAHLSKITGPAGNEKETAYAIWVLSELKRESGTTIFDPFISEGRRWLKKRLSDNDNETHLGDEVWDTSLALLALNDKNCSQKMIDWLIGAKNSRGSFDGEIWETCFAILAISSRCDLCECDISDSRKWLESLIFPQGKIVEVVSPTYTALILRALQASQSDSLKKAEIVNEVHEVFYLDSSEKDYKNFKWSDEVWGNFMVIWGISGFLRGDEAREVVLKSFEGIKRNDCLRIEDAVFVLFSFLELFKDKGEVVRKAINGVDSVSLVKRQLVSWEDGELVIRITAPYIAVMTIVAASMIWANDIISAFESIFMR